MRMPGLDPGIDSRIHHVGKIYATEVEPNDG